MENKFELTEKERLSYILQFLTLEKLDPTDPTYKNLRVALEEGYSIHYSDLRERFLNHELSIENCRLVLDILDMYRGIIFSTDKLQSENRMDVRFPGFDCNDSLELKMYSYARYFLEDLGRFDEIKKLSQGDYNSHSEMLPKYKQMLSIWQKLPLEKRYNMSNEEINHVLNV